MTDSSNSASPKTAVVERLYGALAVGDQDALGQILASSFTGAATADFPLGLGGSYDSPESMQRDFWWQIGRTWDARAEAEDMRELDDGRVLVIGTYRGSHRASGTPLEAAFTHVITFDGDRISRLEQLTDSAAWASTLPEPELSTIDLRVDEDGIAHLALNRPKARNAITLQLAEETLVAARRLEADPRVRAVLITGRGDHFTVGGDISTFLETDLGLGANLRQMTTPFHEAFRILSRLDAPIVTATRGAVAGGGIGYVYASDISIASETTRFVTAFADLGVSGDGGWSWHLPRRVGAARAAEITLLNRPVLADEAAQIGLVSRTVADSELDETALAVARQLAAGPTKGFGQMRRLLRETWTRGLDEQLRYETEVIEQTGHTRDSNHAIEAFLAKKRPTFEGR